MTIKFANFVPSCGITAPCNIRDVKTYAERHIPKIVGEKGHVHNAFMFTTPKNHTEENETK